MILLTGATGFLGKYILDELTAAGEQVRVLVRDPNKFAARPGIEVMEGDILDMASLEMAMDGVDKVVHAAAIVSFWSKRRDELHLVNVQGTANVVDAALDAKVKQFVHVSSVAALGRTDQPVGKIDESAKWVKSKYNTNYGRTKYLAELEVHRGIQEGLPAVICNPAIIIGAGDWNSGSPRLFSTIAKGLKFYNPGTTGFVSAVDVAKAIVLLVNSNIHDGQRFLLVSDSLPYKTFFQWVAESVKSTAPSIAPPAFVAKAAGRWMVMMAAITGKEPMITPETIRTSGGLFMYEGNKICRELGFQYSDLRKTIQDTGAQYLQENAR